MRIDDNSTKLAFFQGLYEDAKEKWEPIRSELKKYWEQYEGGKTVDGSDKPVNYVRNITYELIESSIDTYIPPAQVRPRKANKANRILAKTMQRYLNDVIARLPFEELNDMDERMARIFGASVWLVEWDNGIGTHNTQGDIAVQLIHPLQFIPQPAVYDVDKMDYWFIETADTHENVARKYNVSFDEVSKEPNEDEQTSDDTCTVVTAGYRDEKGNVCKYVWTGETELEDNADMWARKVKKCHKCGQLEDDCKCKHPDFSLSSDEYEEIDETMIFCDGEKAITPLTPIIKDGVTEFEEFDVPLKLPDGTPAMQSINGVILPVTGKTRRPKTKPTKVPFYKPDVYPIVIRKNISVPNQVYGLSDCKHIRDQQQAVNKLEHRINEKSLNAGVAIVKKRGTKFELTSEIFKTGIEVDTLEEAAALKTLDLRVDTTQDQRRSNDIYDHAKRIFGISDSFQGQEDSTANSGIAKQLQINQSSSRLDPKRIMKSAASYERLYKRIALLSLAFIDEPRAVSFKNDDGDPTYEEFDRHAFLELDRAGEWYYNDDFLFTTSPVADVQHNRQAMWTETRNNYTSGAYGNPQDIDTQIYYWATMEKLYYPTAAETLEMFKNKKQQMMAAAAQMQQQAIAQPQAQIQGQGAPARQMPAPTKQEAVQQPVQGQGGVV